jgi:NTP pyrophosphatase (non-canonical NTP hydrolase)
MTFFDYQTGATEFRLYPRFPYFTVDSNNPDIPILTPPIYPYLKLSGEAGELIQKVGKNLRGDKPLPSRNDLLLELGDILWYIAACADDLGATLEEVANLNLAKLRSRRDRNTLQGSGDDR